MGAFYDSSFDCYMQCVSTRKAFPDQLKVGIVYHCKTQFFDGDDLYTHVFLPDNSGEHDIGIVKLEHFTGCID